MTDGAKIAKDMQDLAVPLTDSLRSMKDAAVAENPRSIVVQTFSSDARSPEAEETGCIENKR